MASTYDDFLTNFDLNQFGIEETVQPNYEKLRKTTHLLKKKIITTDFVVQRYLAKTEDYNQALKAHSLTKEDLKQVCINFKNTSERCLQLELDLKLSQANQEALEKRATEAETKYEALISYSNQIEALIKDLKTENEALVIEKKLDVNRSKVLQLQKENELLRKNILDLPDAILPKKKKSKQHLKIQKADSNNSKSDDSADETDSQSSYSRRKSYKINALALKDSTLNMEPDFIDNDLDSCNEEVSIDTGRGSSRANSDKNDLNSPEYYNFEAPLKLTDNDLVKRNEVATSPITVHELISVSTSPIIFDTSFPLFEDLDKYDVDNCDDTCTVYAIMEEKNNLVDSCTSPISIFSEFHKFIDIGTSPIKELKDITVKEDIKKSIAKSLFTDLDEDNETKQMELVSEHVICSCQKSDVIKTKTNVIDVCTSPISELSFECHTETQSSNNTVDHKNLKKYNKKSGRTSPHDCENEEENHESNILKKEATKSCCDKFTSTEIRTDTEKKIVDVCTSPVFKSFDNSHTVNNDISPVYVSDCKEDTQNENSCQEELTLESSVVQKQTHKRVSEDENLNQINSTQAFNNVQEKICLENNSMNVCFDTKDDDTEVQNILSMMKFHRNLISPLPNSPPNIPFNSSYWNMHIKNIYELIEKCNNNIKIVHNDVKEIKRRDAASFQDSINEIVGTESSKGKETDGQQHIISNTHVKEKAEEGEEEEEYISDIIVLSNTENCNISDGYEDISMLEGSSCLMSNITNVDNSKTGITPNKTTRISKINEVIGIPEAENNNYQKKSQHKKQVTDFEFEDGEAEIVNINLENSSETNKISDIKLCSLNSSKKSTPKTKTKSKLQKLRHKMLPISKIKKIAPSISKNVLKVRKNIPKEITSPSVKQKIAYEKAVQVMSELKSKETIEIQSKAKLSANYCTQGAASDKNSSKFESPPFYSNIISTRSRTSKLSEKEDDASITVSPTKLKSLDKRTSDVEISPSRRKTRKRPADNVLDNLQSSRKRSLRSANDIIFFSPIRIEIEPCDDDIEFKPCNENLGNLEELEKELCINSQDNRREVDDIDQSIEEQAKRLLLIQNDHIESSPISDLMIDKSDKNIEIDKSLKNLHDQPAEPLSSDKVEENEKQQNYHFSLNQNMKIAEPIISDYNVNIGAQAEDSCILKSTENVGRIVTVQNNEKDSNQNIIQNGANPLDHKLKDKTVKITLKKPVVELSSLGNDIIANYKDRVVSYSDLDIYSIDPSIEETHQNKPAKENQHMKENILCAALERYGVNKVKLNAKKIPESITNTICQKIEQSIADVIASPKDQQKNKMNQLIHSIQGFKLKQILAGLMKYLKDPTRKCELFNTINNGSAPSMTRSEVILLYVIEHLNVFLHSGDFIQNIYANIEHALFQLNHSPSFDIIESMSHFYAVMCRYFRNKSRLRCFMLDAMYCLQFKAVSLIKQCLDVCPGVLPYAHEHMAKTSLVTCLVYLLHFYKCTDKYNRVQEIRNILSRKYQYRFSEWNETMILEIFRKAIMNLRDMNNDKKMLRLALIILCKRHGANWCQSKIIQNMLLPIIQQPAVPEKIKQFCVLMLGPLLKPFPADKKAQCEIVINQLLQLLKNNPSHEMQEAVYSSLIFVSKHDKERVVQALLSWSPGKVSNDFEEILNDYVMERPLSVWKKLVTKPSQSI